MTTYKKPNFSEGDTVDTKLDGINSSQIAFQTPSDNHANASFEVYLSVGGFAYHGPVDLVDPTDRTTPLTALTGANKMGLLDASGCTHVRVKRKADGVGGSAQGLYWSATTL